MLVGGEKATFGNEFVLEVVGLVELFLWREVCPPQSLDDTARVLKATAKGLKPVIDTTITFNSFDNVVHGVKNTLAVLFKC